MGTAIIVMVVVALFGSAVALLYRKGNQKLMDSIKSVSQTVIAVSLVLVVVLGFSYRPLVERFVDNTDKVAENSDRLVDEADRFNDSVDEALDKLDTLIEDVHELMDRLEQFHEDFNGNTDELNEILRDLNEKFTDISALAAFLGATQGG